MPVSYELDPSSAFIRTRCVGAMTLPEVLAHCQELASDPSRPEKPDVLLDLSECENYTVSYELGHMQEETLKWGAFAIVADRDVLFGMSRMLQSLSASYFTQSAEFKAIDEAEYWLESVRA